jgi:hypothetical protein
MVDYVAVLRRTIDALPKNTPDIRERVYAKARTTVQSKLGLINPPPSEALIAKQMSGLEAAISTVEADFAVAVGSDIPAVPIVQEADALADILNALPNLKAASSLNAETPVKPVTSRPFPIDLPQLPERGRLPDTSTLYVPEVEEARNTLASAKDSFDSVFGDLPQSVRAPASNTMSDMPTLDDPVVPPVFTRGAKPKARPGRVLFPLLGLAILGGAGVYGWTERDRIEAFVKSLQPSVVASQPEAPAEPTAPPVTGPATDPATEPAATPAEPAVAAPQKFTQRLNADGTEIDAGAGAAGGEQSVAQLEPAAEPATPAEPPAAEPPATEPTAPVVAPPAAETPVTDTPVTDTPVTDAPAVAPPAAETPVAPVAPATPAEAVPVGQKAIFYEERTSGAEGSARTGAVVWSVVRESPGNDRPPEPAVRGELTIPEAGLSVRMTLRRNADTTLPASHILELIMTVPDDFAGGTIEDVQRVNLKPSEENAGAPLNATPVKVADKFFLVALENNPAAIKSNLALLRDQSWIDLPVVYRSGRRALFTMEKGLVGDQVFKQVLDAWAAAPLQ